MPPTSSPPNFYQNVAQMSPAGPKAGGGTPGGGKGGKNPDAELLAGYNGMYKLMSKMQEAKPELQQGFEAVQEILKKQLVDIFKQNPDEVMKPEGGASATPPGGASPQGDQPAPAPTPDADRVPA
jgi:hypothetical protein